MGALVFYSFYDPRLRRRQRSISHCPGRSRHSCPRHLELVIDTKAVADALAIVPIASVYRRRCGVAFGLRRSLLSTGIVTTVRGL